MGIDITGPPSLIRPFLIIKRGESHVLLCSDLYDKDEEDFAENYSDDELNMARLRRGNLRISIENKQVFCM